MGLRLRILLICLLLAGLSTLTVVGGVVLPKLAEYPRLNAQMAHEGEQAARLAALSVESTLADEAALLARLGDHEYLVYRNHAKASELMARTSAAMPIHAPIVALDDSFHVVASSGPVHQRDFGVLAAARAAVRTPALVRSGLVAWPDGGKLTSVGARRFKYYDRQGEHWGVLVAALDLPTLDRLLNQHSGQVEVFDAGGRPIVPPPTALPAAPPGLGRQEVQIALKGSSGATVHRSHEVTAYSPVHVGDTSWAVVLSQPAAQALLPLDRDIRQAWLAGLAAMAIGAVLAVLLSAYLVKPIRRLDAGAAALARGEWEAGGAAGALLPDQRRDELGRLAASFEQMAAQLRDRFRGIEDLVAQRTVDLGEANAKLLAAVEDLKALDELKRAFLDAVSHELRTPLNFIMGYGSTVADGLLGPLTAEQAHAMEVILAGSDRLLGVVNDLIEISRLEAGDISLVPVALELEEAIAIALSQLERIRDERGVPVELVLPADLPPAFADPERVGQILRQLLSNAFKFTEANGLITLRVSVEEVATGDAEPMPRLVTRVIDTGCGIAPEALPHIWDAFRQGDGSLTRRFGGTGVGLAIVKRLIEAMGERIDVESREGEGSCFRFTLPIAQLDDGASAHRNVARAADTLPAGRS